MSVQNGKKNRYGCIEHKSDVRDAYNNVVSTWVPLLWRWAAIAGDSGRSSIRAAESGQPINVNRVSIRINYDRDKVIRENMRFVLPGIVYDIRGIRHDEAKREFTDLICEEGGNSG